MSQARNIRMLKAEEEGWAKWWSFVLVLGVLFFVALGLVAVGRFEGGVSGDTRLRRCRVLNEKHVDRSMGPIVPMNLDEDMVWFKTTDGRSATPFLRSLDIVSPEIRHRCGRIIGTGWVISLLIIAGLWIPARRRKESNAA